MKQLCLYFFLLQLTMGQAQENQLILNYDNASKLAGVPFSLYWPSIS